jgi:AraC-like DNA-binding protein
MPAVQFVTGLDIHLPAGYYCPTHAHAVFELVFHCRGRGETTVGASSTYAFTDGSVVFYPPHIPHDQRLTTAGEDCCVLLAFPDGLPAPFTQCGYLPTVSDPMIRDDLVYLSRTQLPTAAWVRASVHARATAVVAWMLQAIATVVPIPVTSHPAVEQAYLFLQHEYHRPLRIEEVARAVDLSASYLRHQFRARYGMSLVQCLSHIRIARACDLLRHTRLPIETIAQLSGFENARYFSTVFRQQQHCTPSQFRRSKR